MRYLKYLFFLLVVFASVEHAPRAFASVIYTSPQGSTLSETGVIVYSGTDTGFDVQMVVS